MDCGGFTARGASCCVVEFNRGRQMFARTVSPPFHIILHTWAVTWLLLSATLTKADRLSSEPGSTPQQGATPLSVQKVVLRTWATSNLECGNPYLDEEWKPNILIAKWKGVKVVGQNVVGLTVPSEHICTALPVTLTALSGLTALNFASSKPQTEAVQQLQGNHTTAHLLPDEWSALTRLADLQLRAYPGLSGPIPPSYSSLHALTRFSAGENSFTGSLPSSWSELTRLKEMDVSQSIYERFTPIPGLSGPIPPSFSSLNALTRFSAGGNSLTGSLPSSWSKLTRLVEIHLSQNSIRGPLPPPWSTLVSLTNVQLSRNPIEGPLPPAWSTLRQLDTLEITQSFLEATLPGQWQTMTVLKSLSLGYNNITGQLPAAWSQLGSLEDLALNGNDLTGPLPSQWSTLSSNLASLSLARNNLSGTLPSVWSALSQLTFLTLEANMLRGTLVSAWTDMYSLNSLSLLDNHLTGTLPAAWSMLAAMTQLFLVGNQLKGTLPKEWSLLSDMKELYLQENSLTGSLPPSWSEMVALDIVYLSDNRLNGSLPDEWGALSMLEGCALYRNNLTGTIPASWSAMKKLSGLNLADNQLDGSLPASWKDLQLQALDVSNNRLTGPVPQTWFVSGAVPQAGGRSGAAAKNNTSRLAMTLYRLELSNNQLGGALSALPQGLKYLNVSNNRLTGPIPPFPRTLTFAQLDRNLFNGAIPSMRNAVSLRYLNVANNQLTSLPEVLDAPALGFFNAANNSLAGPIPDTWNQESLIFADLSGNQLSGSFPKSWAEKNWTFLSIDNNQLSGSLPNPWTGNTFVLLARFNRLTGCLPSMWTHNNTAFVLALSHNPLNCSAGLPASWGGQPSPSFQTLAVLDLDNTHPDRVIPKSWLGAKAFPNVVDLELGDLWKQSARYNEKWRRDVCINKRAYAKVTKLAVSNITSTFTENVQQKLAEGLDGLGDVLASGDDTNVVLFYAPQQFLNLTYSLESDSSSSSSTARRSSILDNVCSNKQAKLIVAAQYTTLAVVLLLLVFFYWLCTKFYWHGRLRSLLNRPRRTTGVLRHAVHSPRSAECARWFVDETVALGRALMWVLRLGTYWADIVLDIVLLTRVWGNWPGWALLTVLLVHYVVSSSVVAFRLWQLGRHVVAVCVWLLMPLQPLADTFAFFVVALQELPFMHHCHHLVRWWQSGPVASLIDDWERLLHMREVLEVLFEAVPTCILQSIVFILGNNPQIGWYFSTHLYLWSAASSSFQIIRVVALVLWTALMRDTSPVQALWDLVSYKAILPTSPPSQGAAAQGPKRIIEVGPTNLKTRPIRTSAPTSPLNQGVDRPGVIYSPVSSHRSSPYVGSPEGVPLKNMMLVAGTSAEQTDNMLVLPPPRSSRATAHTVRFDTRTTGGPPSVNSFQLEDTTDSYRPLVDRSSAPVQQGMERRVDGTDDSSLASLRPVGDVCVSPGVVGSHDGRQSAAEGQGGAVRSDVLFVSDVGRGERPEWMKDI